MAEEDKKILQALTMIKEAKKILFITGAGISTASGIADFRGENGLYQQCKKKYALPYPEAIFDIKYFTKESPIPFYKLTKEFFEKEYKPSRFHSFISSLETKDKDVTIVTQNIDGLHQKAGSKKVIAAHGDYSKSSCINCKKPYDPLLFIKNCKADKESRCSCGGLIKPHIVFFGENLPSPFMDIYLNPPKVDLCITCGTSLTVYPVADFARIMALKTSSILINNQLTPLDSLFSLVITNDLEKLADIFITEIINK